MYEYGKEVLPKVAVCKSDMTIEVKKAINAVLGNEKEYISWKKGEELQIIDSEDIDYIWREKIVKDGYYICQPGSEMSNKYFEIKEI